MVLNWFITEQTRWNPTLSEGISRLNKLNTFVSYPRLAKVSHGWGHFSKFTQASHKIQKRLRAFDIPIMTDNKRARLSPAWPTGNKCTLPSTTMEMKHLQTCQESHLWDFLRIFHIHVFIGGYSLMTNMRLERSSNIWVCHPGPINQGADLGFNMWLKQVRTMNLHKWSLLVE